jgi:integrase
MPNGKLSPTFHYRIMVDGKIHTGSTGCATRVDALKFERDKLDVLRQQRSAKAVVENFRDELAGGKRIDLEDAFEAFRGKPKRKSISDRQMGAKRTYWSDWLAFLKARYPSAKRLSDVTLEMAQAYIHHLRESGKFAKTVEFKPKYRRKAITYEGSYTELSPRTVNVYHKTLQQIFGALADDASLIENPFSKIPKQNNDYQQRDAFTPEELKKIGEASRAGDPFIYALFAVGMATGLREGDICTLRWQEIDLAAGWIARKMSKTSKLVRIPIMPPLRAFLEQAAATRQPDQEYVLPEHARVYLSNPSGIGYRVRGFLEGLEITTAKKVEGRSRRVSVKDVHSLRHTFCYLAAIHGVPANIVQSIVGHMDERMTQMYMDHASDQVKRDKLSQLPDFLGQLPQATAVTPAAPPPANEAIARAIAILEQMQGADASRWPELREEALVVLRALPRA